MEACWFKEDFSRWKWTSDNICSDGRVAQLSSQVVNVSAMQCYSSSHSSYLLITTVKWTWTH